MVYMGLSWNFTVVVRYPTGLGIFGFGWEHFGGQKFSAGHQLFLAIPSASGPWHLLGCCACGPRESVSWFGFPMGLRSSMIILDSHNHHPTWLSGLAMNRLIFGGLFSYHLVPCCSSFSCLSMIRWSQQTVSLRTNDSSSNENEEP